MSWGRPPQHDYIRNGTTTLFAALNVLEGGVIGRCMQHHRHQEFIRFLNAVEAEVPAGKLVHAIMDMCGRPLRSKRNLQRRMACGSGADMCPAFDAAVTCRGPVWEFADRGQSNLARLDSACP
jgi:hypothetical protein